jgi:hypothetical protein
MAYQEWGSGPPHFDGKNYQMWSNQMAAFLYGKGQILWDVTVDTGYVQLMNFLAPGSRDMFDANNKVIDYLFRALCQPEFDQVHTEHLACRIWLVLKEAHVGNAQVQARMYSTNRREYENFTHLPGESIDALFQSFMVGVNNMRALRCCFGLVVLGFWTLEGTFSVWSFPRVRCFVLVFLSLMVWSVVSWLVLRVSCASGIGSWVT